MANARGVRVGRGRISAIGIAVLAGLAVIAASCTPPTGPAPRNWKVRPVSIEVLDQEDTDGGDEPYVIQIGFRSKLGVAGSTDVSIASQCRSGALPPADSGPVGAVVSVPPGSADISFPGVTNLDVGDLALGFAPLEIIGTLAFVAERDGIFATCAITDLLDSSVRPLLDDALELLIASQPVPPTQEQLIALITDNISSLLGVIGGLIAAFIEGFGNPDDIIGIAAQIHLPTAGAFTNLLNTAFQIAGLFEPDLSLGILPLDQLGSGLKIRVGSLTSSTVDILLGVPGTSYRYRSSVIPDN
ncbi:MAG: hypothetical protein FJW94_00820 [Actinobacteria bacterium]|nr:hypothetical protein [Actinomycetota bacterium]